MRMDWGFRPRGAKGWLRGVGAGVLLLLGGVLLSAETSRFRMTQYLETLLSVFQTSMTVYVEEPDAKRMVERGIQGMLRELDPYSEYIPAESVESWQFVATGAYAGVGMLIRPGGDYALAAEIYQGTPSDRAGLRAGDTLKRINGEDLRGKSVGQVSDMLRGQPNTALEITISRPWGPRDSVVRVVRDNVHVPAVSYSTLLGKGYAYVMLNTFTQGCAKEVEMALRRLEAEAQPQGGLRGIVLDLRGNTGGIIEEAQRLVGLFIPAGQVVFEVKGRGGKGQFSALTEGEAPYRGVPLVVMVDRSSASSSEIVVGALQDLDRAVVVGDRTFGKGLVQTTQPLPYGGTIKLTSARYYTPSGRCIQALDYSHLTEQGAVGKIPDSLVSEYSTRRGRKVYDGGGIFPDLMLVDSAYTLFISTLYQNDAFFDYATKYRAEHASIGPLRDFVVTPAMLNDFALFCQGRGLDARSALLDEVSRVLNLMRDQDQSELMLPYVDSMRVKLRRSFMDYFHRYSARISELLEGEIVSRYYYRAGRLDRHLIRDWQLDSARALLGDTARMGRILREISPNDPRRESVQARAKRGQEKAKGE